MIVVVGSELRKQNGPDDGSNFSLAVLQSGCVALAVTGVLSRVEVLVPAYQLLYVLVSERPDEEITPDNFEHTHRTCNGQRENIPDERDGLGQAYLVASGYYSS